MSQTAAYLLTWNPQSWTWDSLSDDSASVRAGGDQGDSNWSCGRTKRIQPGDRLFLVKLGPEEPRGLMASGSATSEVYESTHWQDPGRKANYVDLEFDALLDLDEYELLPMSRLEQPPLDDMLWSPQGSGISIKPDALNDNYL